MNSIDRDLETSANSFHKSKIQQKSLSEQADGFKEVNKNGFTNRPTIYQTLPILYVFLMTCQIFGVLALVLKVGEKFGLATAYATLLFATVILWYITTKMDPTDSIQLLHRSALANKKQMQILYFKFFCHICQTCVSKSSFHCRVCNRCVDCFDHHCKWLNNCIGAKNYLQFLALIIFVEILLIFHTIVNAIDISRRRQITENFHWIFYIQIAFIITNLVLISFNSALIGMHLYLVIKKKTTIQFILEKRKISKIHPFEINNEESKQEKPQLIIDKQKSLDCNTIKNQSSVQNFQHKFFVQKKSKFKLSSLNLKQKRSSFQ